MSHLRIGFFAYLALVLQTVFADQSWAGGWIPDFFTLALFAAICTTTEPVSLCWAGLIGLLRDGVSSGPIGAYLIAYTLLAVFLPRLNRTDGRLSLPLFVLTLFVTSLLVATSHLLSDAMITFEYNSATWSTSHVGTLLCTALMTTTLGVCGIGVNRLIKYLIGFSPDSSPNYANRWKLTSR